MALCIGFVGENGAGKSTALKIIKSALPTFSSKELRFSATLSATLKIWGIEENRANLQLLAQVMDNAYGKGSLSRALTANAKGMSEDILFLDGVRWPTDEKAVRSFPSSLIIYVTAPQIVRFNRLVTRKEKIGEGSMTWEQFLNEDCAPNEQFTKDIGSRADFIIRDTVSIETCMPAITHILSMHYPSST